MNIGLEIFLLIGFIFMCVLISMQMKWYGDKIWKSFFVSVAIIITGLVSCKIWFFLENGYWGARSFYGAIFFAPLTFLVAAKLLKIPYLHSLDYCATAGCLIFSILKIDCLIGGCCKGIVLGVKQNGDSIRFPSQAVELIAALILTVFLFNLSKKPEKQGKIYPITLVLYGSQRFLLNFLRDDWERTKALGLGIPLGCVWSLVAVAIGIAWLYILRKSVSAEKTDSSLCSE